MSDAEIIIVYAYLDTLADQCKNVAQSMSNKSTATNLSFGSNDSVTNEYERFLSCWDRHRSRLEDGVNGAGEAMSSVSKAFSSLEDELIKALEGNQGSQGSRYS